MAQITVLGSGDAFGTPMPGCTINSCVAKTPQNNRTRFSLLLETNKHSILIAASPDLRSQLIRENISIKKIDHIFLTHSHYDQIGGLSEFDAIGDHPPIKLISDQRIINETQGYYNYLFKKKRLAFEPVDLGIEKKFDEFSVTSFELNHYKCFCIGFRIKLNNKIIVVAVDTNSNLKPESLNAMKNADILFLDGMAESLQQILLAKRDLSGKSEEKFKVTVEPNKRGHMVISEAIDLSKQLSATKTILAHFSHYNSPHEEMQKKYETQNLTLAFDGAKIFL